MRKRSRKQSKKRKRWGSKRRRGKKEEEKEEKLKATDDEEEVGGKRQEEKETRDKGSSRARRLLKSLLCRQRSIPQCITPSFHRGCRGNLIKRATQKGHGGCDALKISRCKAWQ